MWLRKFLTASKSRPSVATFRSPAHRPRTPRLAVEALDDRCLPSNFTVTNLLDSGAGSLRDAVAAANTNPGADDIAFAVTGSIALTSGELDITDSLTINGPGAGALTISGNQASRVFDISGAPTVTIADLTVANGATIDSPGAGISVAGGTVTLDHVTVTGNIAYGAPYLLGNYFGDGLGGGLYVAGGTLTLDQCTVTGNYASGGYGLDADVTWGGGGGNGGGGYGGGLYVGGGVVHVNQCTISGNHAGGGSGGVGRSYDGFDGIGGNGGWSAGGGVYVAAGGVDFAQSTLTDNMAFGGPGGFGDNDWGADGVGWGGGLSTLFADPPVAELDTFTESNTINNFADFNPNISGSYSLNGMPVLAIRDVSIQEGNSGTTAFVFTVSLSAPSSQAVTVSYATADGSATAGSDYQAASGTLTIPAGQTTGTITVLVNGDRLGEPNETLVVILSSPTNATIADGLGQGTIVDDEPRISIGDVTRMEGNSGTTPFAFTVSLSAAYDAPVTVAYVTADGSTTAGSDYQAASGTLTIPAGQPTGTITVLVNGDRVAEPNETFIVILSSPTNATIADGQRSGTIVDDDQPVSIRISDVTKTEGKKGQTTLFTFTVTLSAAFDQAVTMSYRTVNGTAKASDNDYVAKTGTLTFAPGETTKTIIITVKGDSKREADETFYLDLFGNSGNSLFSKKRGVGTILNDD